MSGGSLCPAHERVVESVLFHDLRNLCFSDEYEGFSLQLVRDPAAMKLRELARKRQNPLFFERRDPVQPSAAAVARAWRWRRSSSDRRLAG